jgi:UDP-N-acetylglucosamine diphosphorylase/glucosamine-1-phosphate N-acetyltransferase
MSKLKTIVLAAGKGTRMRTDGSDAPKVMRLALGKPLLSYVLASLPVENESDAVVVVGYMKEQVMEAFSNCTFAIQSEQLGTGHAVMCAESALSDFDGDVLICCGDTPLVSRDTYTALLETHISENNDCTMLSGTSQTPMKGYGRVSRTADGGFDRIIEEKDCTPAEAAIQEYNSGIYIFKAKKLFSALKELKTDNAQGEYYLTDTPDIMKKRGDKVGICTREMGSELIGVNTPEQLHEVEQILSQR